MQTRFTWRFASRKNVSECWTDFMQMIQSERTRCTTCCDCWNDNPDSMPRRRPHNQIPDVPQAWFPSRAENGGVTMALIVAKCWFEILLKARKRFDRDASQKITSVAWKIVCTAKVSGVNQRANSRESIASRLFYFLVSDRTTRTKDESIELRVNVQTKIPSLDYCWKRWSHLRLKAKKQARYRESGYCGHIKAALTAVRRSLRSRAIDYNDESCQKCLLEATQTTTNNGRIINYVTKSLCFVLRCHDPSRTFLPTKTASGETNKNLFQTDDATLEPSPKTCMQISGSRCLKQTNNLKKRANNQIPFWPAREMLAFFHNLLPDPVGDQRKHPRDVAIVVLLPFRSIYEWNRFLMSHVGGMWMEETWFLWMKITSSVDCQ